MHRRIAPSRCNAPLGDVLDRPGVRVVATIPVIYVEIRVMIPIAVIPVDPATVAVIDPVIVVPHAGTAAVAIVAIRGEGRVQTFSLVLAIRNVLGHNRLV